LRRDHRRRVTPPRVAAPERRSCRTGWTENVVSRRPWSGVIEQVLITKSTRVRSD
jgi:hypothetical protein